METLQRFGIAGIAGCGATCCVHPLDVVRVNLQVDATSGKMPIYKGTFHCISTVANTGGIRSLYNGLSAGIFRQITYGMPRMAVYPILMDVAKSSAGLQPEDSLPLSLKFLCGATAGGSAALLGVPSEVSLVRMAADAKLAANDPARRNYLSVFDALMRIKREEGVAKLWEGAAPTIARAILINAGQLAVYSEAKEQIRRSMQIEGLALQLSSSLVSATVAVALSCPADVVKSRMQNMRTGQFSGAGDCISQLVRNEGVLALWKGYTPAVIKLAPHTVISFIILDNLSRYILGKEML